MPAEAFLYLQRWPGPSLTGPGLGLGSSPGQGSESGECIGIPRHRRRRESRVARWSRARYMGVADTLGPGPVPNERRDLGASCLQARRKYAVKEKRSLFLGEV